MANIHLICQSKGGVGKSFVAVLLAQYLKEKNSNLRLFDTDPNNQSMTSFAALNSNYINPINTDDNSLSSGSFFPLYETVIAENTDCIIDTGSSTFIQIIDFFRSHDQSAVDDLAENGYNLVLHMPIAPGAPRSDCIATITATLRDLPKINIAVWVNNYPDPVIGPTEKINSVIDLFPEELRDGIGAVVNLPYMKRDTDLRFLRYMLDENRIFKEVLDLNNKITLNNRPIYSLERRYLKGIHDDLWTAMSVLDNLVI